MPSTSTNLLLTLLPILLLISPTYTQYNQQWSYTLNRFSAITHCTQSQILNWNCKICKQGQKLQDISYIYLPLTNVMGFAGYFQSATFGKYVILSMRGTTDIKNWIQNFSFKMVNYGQCKGCTVHQGFYLDYLSVAAKITSVIKGLLAKHPDAKLIVTGSSLGGALATIAGLELQLQTGKVDQLHVFGCPRVGNPNYAQFLTLKITKIYRVIHNLDIVPHVPLQTQNFHHPAYEILFNQSMDVYKQCNQSGQDPTCSNSYAPNYSTHDHTSYWFKPVQEDVCTP